MTRLLLRAAFVTLVCGFASAAGAQSPVPALKDLAASWSAGSAASRCQDAPGTLDLPPQRRLQDCEWPTVSRGRESGTVTGSRGPNARLHALFWQRTVTDTNDARRLADSLGVALRADGLAEFACPDAGRRWQRPGLTVQFAHGAVGRDGLLHLMVFATTLPSAIPAFTCPDAPALPMPAAVPPRQGRVSS